MSRVSWHLFQGRQPRAQARNDTLRMQSRVTGRSSVVHASGSTKWPGALSGTAGTGGKIVGPMSFEEVAVRINRAPNEKHLVWTAGMVRWADAKTVPAFTDLFRGNPPPLPALALSSLSYEDENCLDQAREPGLAARIARIERAASFAGWAHGNSATDVAHPVAARS